VLRYIYIRRIRHCLQGILRFCPIKFESCLVFLINIILSEEGMA